MVRQVAPGVVEMDDGRIYDFRNMTITTVGEEAGASVQRGRTTGPSSGGARGDEVP